jgi:hypothetical protein
MSIRLLNPISTALSLGSRSRCSAISRPPLKTTLEAAGCGRSILAEAWSHHRGSGAFPARSVNFLLTNERDIYQRIRGGHWEPHGAGICHRRHQDLFKMQSKCFRFSRGSRKPQVMATILYEDGIGRVGHAVRRANASCGRLHPVKGSVRPTSVFNEIASTFAFAIRLS